MQYYVIEVARTVLPVNAMQSKSRLQEFFLKRSKYPLNDPTR